VPSLPAARSIRASSITWRSGTAIPASIIRPAHTRTWVRTSVRPSSAGSALAAAERSRLGMEDGRDGDYLRARTCVDADAPETLRCLAEISLVVRNRELRRRPAAKLNRSSWTANAKCPPKSAPHLHRRALAGNFARWLDAAVDARTTLDCGQQFSARSPVHCMWQIWLSHCRKTGASRGKGLELARGHMAAAAALLMLSATGGSATAKPATHRQCLTIIPAATVSLILGPTRITPGE
jgi:hypothetical protein